MDRGRKSINHVRKEQVTWPAIDGRSITLDQKRCTVEERGLSLRLVLRKLRKFRESMRPSDQQMNKLDAVD